MTIYILLQLVASKYALLAQGKLPYTAFEWEEVGRLRQAEAISHHYTKSIAI
jgi:hypothetical protein